MKYGWSINMSSVLGDRVIRCFSRHDLTWRLFKSVIIVNAVERIITFPSLQIVRWLVGFFVCRCCWGLLLYAVCVCVCVCVRVLKNPWGWRQVDPEITVLSLGLGFHLRQNFSLCSSWDCHRLTVSDDHATQYFFLIFAFLYYFKSSSLFIWND